MIVEPSSVPLEKNTLVCEVLKVKHAIADSMVVYFVKSKNCTHFLQSGQVFEIQGCNGIVCSPL